MYEELLAAATRAAEAERAPRVSKTCFLHPVVSIDHRVILTYSLSATQQDAESLGDLGALDIRFVNDEMEALENGDFPILLETFRSQLPEGITITVEDDDIGMAIAITSARLDILDAALKVNELVLEFCQKIYTKAVMGATIAT